MSQPLQSPKTNRNAILALILVSYVMIVLDTSIVITGLLRIRADLGFSDAGLSWVSNIYTLFFGGFLLLGARAGDILGRRRMFVSGLILFTMSSLMIGLAQSAGAMIAARAIQGLGAAILAPSSLALLQTHFQVGPERTRAISFYASAAGISASVGLVLGGVLADWVSWRAGFFINLPIGAGLIFLTLRHVEETERHTGAFDLAGALASTLGMGSLVFGIVRSASTSWLDPLAIEASCAGVLLLAAFVFIESKARQPIMPLRLFASRERSGAYAARLLFLGANVGFFFFSTQFMQGVLGFSGSQAGLAFLPAMVVNFVTALQAPKLIARFGGGAVLAASMSLAMLGMLWLSQCSVDSSYLTGLAVPMLMVGIGQGGSLGPLTTSGISGVAPSDAGAASGVVNAAHQLGSALGLGILVAASAAGANKLKETALLAHRVDNAMFGAAVLVGVALFIAVLTVWKTAKPLAAVHRRVGDDASSDRSQP